MLGSTAYSVATGETLITGTKLSTEERLWAAADLVATGLSAGSTKILGLAEAGKLSTKAADVVEGSSSLLKVTKHADDVMDAINIGKDVVTGDVQSLVMDAGMVGLSAVVKARNNTTVKTGGDSVNSDYQNYVARKKANGESYLSEADWTQKVSTLSANTAAYSDFKASALESFKGTATDVESNITIETRNAAGDVQRVQVKVIGFDEAGNVRIQDYTTAANGLSVNRQSLLDDLSKYGGTVVGDGKGAFTGGTEIKPGTQIDVVSQKTAGTTIKETVSSVKVPETYLTTAERYDEIPIVEYAQQMSKDYTSADVEELTRLTTHNANSDTALLGPYSPDTSSYEQIAHENGFTYFDAGTNGWNAISEVDRDLAHSVNEEFLQQQIDSGKDIVLTYDPAAARRTYVESGGRIMISYNDELDKLGEYGYHIVKEGQFWRATK